MREDDDWILYSNYSDPEKIRTRLNSELSHQAGMYSKETRFVELINNGKYDGLYTLATTIDEKSFGYTKNSLGLYDDYVFKQIDWSKLKVNQGETEIPGLELKTNKHDSTATAWSNIRNYFHQLSTDFNYDYVKQHTDMSSLIDFILETDFTADYDKIMDNHSIKNVIYGLSNKTDDYKISFVPWDLDISWGRDWKWSKYYNIGPEYRPNTDKGFLSEVMAKGEVKQLLEQRYKELRSNAWSTENILKLIDNCEKDIYDSGAYKRERERWPSGFYIDNRLDKFITFVRKHIEYIDYYYNLRDAKPKPLEKDLAETRK
jgi:spore coat protein CotH